MTKKMIKAIMKKINDTIDLADDCTEAGCHDCYLSMAEGMKRVLAI